MEGIPSALLGCAEGPVCRLQQPDLVLHDTAALHAARAMFDPQPTVVQGLGGQLLLQGPCLAAGCLGGPEDGHLGQHARQEAPILSAPAAGRSGGWCGLGHAPVMDAAITKSEDLPMACDGSERLSQARDPSRSW